MPRHGLRAVHAGLGDDGKFSLLCILISPVVGNRGEPAFGVEDPDGIRSHDPDPVGFCDPQELFLTDFAFRPRFSETVGNDDRGPDAFGAALFENARRVPEGGDDDGQFGNVLHLGQILKDRDSVNGSGGGMNGIDFSRVVPFHEVADDDGGAEKPAFLHAAEQGDALRTEKRIQPVNLLLHASAPLWK